VTKAEAWLNHVANVLVGGTGLVYGWMRYFAEPADEFSVVNHPWQPDLQHLHVLLAPLLVFAGGVIWSRHVWARVRSGFKPRRPSGLMLTGALFPMIASGYLLQVAVDETWRTVWVWVHGVVSCLWLIGYGVHQLSSRGPAARQAGG
jgi:hypothetical protein